MHTGKELLERLEEELDGPRQELEEKKRKEAARLHKIETLRQEIQVCVCVCVGGGMGGCVCVCVGRVDGWLDCRIIHVVYPYLVALPFSVNGCGPWGCQLYSSELEKMEQQASLQPLIAEKTNKIRAVGREMGELRPEMQQLTEHRQEYISQIQRQL